MKKHCIDFTLNKDTKITVELDDPLQLVHCCYVAKIFVIQGNEKVLIGDDALKYYLEIFEYQLQKALSNDLQLHSSLTEDIGLLYNEYKKKPLNFVHEKSKNGIEAWVGDRYELWGYGLCTTWIYNNNDGSIMFELSDIYPGFFIECVPEQEQKKLVPFKQWIQDYKPYFIEEISPDVAQQWLMQAKRVLAAIQTNTERERMMYESNNPADKS